MKRFFLQPLVISSVLLSICVSLLLFLGQNNARAYVVPTSVQIVEIACGNGIQELQEECDGNDLNNTSCVSLGYFSGGLSCNANCTFNVASCVPRSSGGQGVRTESSTYYYEIESTEEKEEILENQNIKRCDLSNDGRISIADLSILLFFYGKSGTAITAYDLNKDGKITIADISIMLYYWKSSL